MRTAMNHITKQTFEFYFRKMADLISGPLKLILGIDVELGHFYKKVNENSRRMHAHLNKYLQDRK